jgi:hypothetical protein
MGRVVAALPSIHLILVQYIFFPMLKLLQAAGIIQSFVTETDRFFVLGNK